MWRVSAVEDNSVVWLVPTSYSMWEWGISQWMLSNELVCHGSVQQFWRIPQIGFFDFKIWKKLTIFEWKRLQAGWQVYSVLRNGNNKFPVLNRVHYLLCYALRNLLFRYIPKRIQNIVSSEIWMGGSWVTCKCIVCLIVW